MNGFAARAALVSLWITIGALGAVLMVMGGINIWAAMKIGEAVGAMAGPGKLVWIAGGLVMFLVGSGITFFCGRRIHSDLTRPMAGASNARAETDIGRMIAVLAFGIGAAVGGYAIYGKGGTYIKSIAHKVTTTTTTAKFISIDELADPAQFLAAAPELHGEKIGTYVYYLPDRTRVEVKGFLPKSFDRDARAGRTFIFTYKGNPPTQYWFAKTKSLTVLFPATLELLILFWMVSAGVTGVYVNIMDDDEREDGYGAEDDYGHGGAVTRAPQVYGGPPSGGGVPGQFGRR